MAEVAPWTRRQLLAAGAATLTTAACAGAGSTPGGDGATRPEPSPSPAPVDVPPDWGPGTLFTPQDVSGRALPTAKHAPTPPWFRAAPAFYCPSPRSGGSVLLTFTGGGRYSLPRRISHFRELPELLAEARSLGTDVLYLIDWYEGAEGESAESALWNKGDYVPRADLGGTKALKAGLAEVHALGGRALSYLELFVIAKSSNIGKKRGKAWSLVTREGREDNLYPKDWKLCPAAPGMDDYMIAAAKRIVGDLGFDGLHLDSYGYQRGWKCTADHGHDKGKPEVFDSTVLDLTRRIHTAIRAEKSDAVLMCEGPKIPGLFRYVSASQDWSVGDVQTRWLWNQQGVTNAFTSHWSLDDIHQIIALGHKLSLGGGFWHEAPPGPSPVAWLKRKPARSNPRQEGPTLQAVLPRGLLAHRAQLAQRRHLAGSAGAQHRRWSPASLGARPQVRQQRRHAQRVRGPEAPGRRGGAGRRRSG